MNDVQIDGIARPKVAQAGEHVSGRSKDPIEPQGLLLYIIVARLTADISDGREVAMTWPLRSILRVEIRKRGQVEGKRKAGLR